MSAAADNVVGMRILHTSDWHLGRTLHGVDLGAAHETFLDWLVNVVRAEPVDAILVAGDVFDRAVPPVPSVELLSDALARLTEHTRVVLTPGNHDSAARLGFGAGLYRDRLVVRSRVAGVGDPVELPAAHGGPGALVYALPYLDPDLSRPELAGPGTDHAGVSVRPPRSHEGVCGAALGRVREDLRQRRAGAAQRLPAVVMAHAFVTGGEASESERDIRVGGVDNVASGVFGPLGEIDYVALGHLHGAQRVGRPGTDPVMRYAGSPLAFSFSERHHHKSVALVNLDDGAAELLPTPVPRRLSDVTGTLAELLGRRFDHVAEHWVRVTVTDDVRPERLWARVTRRFPHALVIQHQPDRAATALAGPDPAGELDPLAVAAQFLEAAGGRAPTEAELAALSVAYESVLADERSA